MKMMSNMSKSAPSTGGIMGPEAQDIVQLVVSVILCGLFSILGLITNVLTARVLAHQGLTDSVSINLFTLAFADFSVCLTTVFWSVLVLTRFISPSLKPDILSLQYIVSGWPHNMFSRMSSAITVLVSLDRCLCVTIPFKVKSLITARRMLMAVFVMCLLTVGCYLPIFVTRGLYWHRDDVTNKTTLMLWFSDNRIQMEHFNDIFNSILIPSLCLLTVVVCTFTMIHGLKVSSKFRQKSSQAQSESKSSGQGGEGSSNGVSTKDRHVVKMVTGICIIFIVFNTPELILICGKMLEPRLNMDRRFQNLFMSLFSLDYFLDSINASVNIFVYYNMSSKFRLAFKKLFKWPSGE